jgi:hypothetical protein
MPVPAMRFLLLIYNDDTLIDALPEGEFDRRMHDCFAHADQMAAEGALLGSQQLESARKARSVRIRDGRPQVTDGPFAETKEVLCGYNVIEADSIEEAVRIAQQFPWAKTGCIEVRPIRDMEAVRTRVGA